MAAVIGAVVWVVSRPQPLSYYCNRGEVFGTYYTIRYQGPEDLNEAVVAQMQAVDDALSMFNPSSLISRINRNEEVCINNDVVRVFRMSEWVNARSQGAFDITVAPLVNAWGFGYTHSQQALSHDQLDSILSFIGMTHLRLENRNLIKDDSRIQLDASAIAKGFACDKVAEALEQAGCPNYLVDIGGEIVLKGHNQQGQPWRIGITRPEDDSTCTQQQIQAVIVSDSLAMATSGNYRRYYYEGGEKRSHTIDPRTGYPVNHSLLSATVVAESCMKADAIATACMVLGAKESIQMVETMENVACYLIVAQGDSMNVVKSSNWDKMVKI